MLFFITFLKTLKMYLNHIIAKKISFLLATKIYKINLFFLPVLSFLFFQSLKCDTNKKIVKF